MVLIQSIVIFKKKKGGGGTYLKLSPNYMSHAMMTPQVFVIRSYNNIGCDDEEEEEVDSDDMEYTEDATCIDNMILEFSGD